MRINNSGRASGVSKNGSAGRAGAGVAFMPAELNGAARAAPAAPLASTAGLDALLAIQTVGGPLESKKRAVRRGQSLLDTLDEIKADLLVGRVSFERLDRLASMLEGMREQSLPGLDAVLDDIELRVRVELAKFGRFPR